MFTSKHRPDRDHEVAQCPVCNAILGRRDKTAIFKAHCAECKATFWWKPWAEKPAATLDSAPKERRYCGKEGCFCRD